MRVRWSTKEAGGQDEGIFAFERATSDERSVVVLNLNSSRESFTRSQNSTMRVGLPAGTALVDALDGEMVLTTTALGCEARAGESCISVGVPPHGIRVLIKE